MAAFSKIFLLNSSAIDNFAAAGTALEAGLDVTVVGALVGCAADRSPCLPAEGTATPLEGEDTGVVDWLCFFFPSKSICFPSRSVIFTLGAAGGEKIGGDWIGT